MRTTAVLLLAFATAACGEDSTPADFFTSPASFSVRPGVEVATVTGAEPGQALTLISPDGRRLVTILADEHGQAHFSYIPAEHLVLASGAGSKFPVTDGRTLDPGAGYEIRDESVDPPLGSGPFTVLEVHDVPDPSLYEGQVLTGVALPLIGDPPEHPEDGFNYITMRDGVKLSAMVRFPDPSLYGDGPFPTVVEYSGYSPSSPDSVEPVSNIALVVGFAAVSVNMRGSGCSGGVFDVFNPAQHADGYDIVEVVARQEWVKGGRVGMVGISYSGISQLFVARTNPPSLAAITPLSVIGDPWEQAWPGGIYNSGFTRQWIEERDRQAAAGGQSWTHKRIQAGDTLCEEHQRLRDQNVDFETFLHQLQFYPTDAVDRSLPSLVGEIELPVYLTGGYQDEQTGGYFSNMLDRFAGAPVTRFTLYNGRHIDALSPLLINRWFEFLSFYVAREIPKVNPLVRIFAADAFAEQYGVPGLDVEEDRFTDFGSDFEGALAAYEAEPDVRLLFEVGGDDAWAPGATVARFEASFDSFPPPEATPRSFYLAPEGELRDAPPFESGADTYRHDPEAGAQTLLGPRGYEIFEPLWDVEWTTFAEGAVLSYLTEPLAADVVMVGPSVAELWMVSEVGDLHVQVTLTEVRPDGNEVLITSGWLRVGHGEVDAAAADDGAAGADLRPPHSFRIEDYAPLPRGEAVRVRVPIPPVGHALRAGTRLRVTVSAPGRNHALWLFEPPDYHGARPVQAVLRGGETPSRVVVSVVDGIEPTASYPPCPSLRGQPCRPYEPRVNQGP